MFCDTKHGKMEHKMPCIANTLNNNILPTKAIETPQPCTPNKKSSQYTCKKTTEIDKYDEKDKANCIFIGGKTFVVGQSEHSCLPHKNSS